MAATLPTSAPVTKWCVPTGPPPATSDKRPKNEFCLPTFVTAQKSCGPSIPGRECFFWAAVLSRRPSPGVLSFASFTPRMTLALMGCHSRYEISVLCLLSFFVSFSLFGFIHVYINSMFSICCFFFKNILLNKKERKKERKKEEELF
jgi:hypothetical protein